MKTFLISGVLLALVFLCYGNTVNNGFVWDDDYLITYNPLVRAPLFTPYRLTQDIANSHFRRSDYYRPLQIFSYALDHRVYGSKPFGYHITNIFLHFVCALLVYLLTLRLCGNKYLSMAVSMLFAVFPANIPAVSYVAGRADLLYFCFGILTVYLFLIFRETKNKKFLFFSCASLILSLLSKESALMIPLILLFMDIFVYGKKRFFIKDHFLYLAVLILYSGGGILLRGGVSVLSGPGMTLSGCFVSFFSLMAGFLEALLSPMSVHVRSSVKVLSAYDYLSVSLLLMFMLLAVIFIKKRRGSMLFAAGMFLSSLLPFVLGIIKTGVLGYHWFYLAGYGFFLFASLTVDGLIGNKGVPLKYGAFIAAMILVSFYSSVIIRKNDAWKDDISLSDTMVSKASADVTPLRFKYTELLSRGENEKVIELAGEDIEKNPESARSWTLYGVMLLEAGKPVRAEKSFTRAIELDPSFSEAYTGLARVLLSENKNEEAIELLKETIKIDNKCQKAYMLITPLYSKKGFFREAFRSAREAVALNPYAYNALINLGSAYLQTGQPAEGMKQYFKAAGLYPEQPLAYYNIGSVFYSSGNKKEAEKWINKALSVDPGYGPAAGMLELIKNDLKKMH